MVITHEDGTIAVRINLDLDDAKDLVRRLTDQIRNAKHTGGAYYVGQKDTEGNRVEFQIRITNNDRARG